MGNASWELCCLEHGIKPDGSKLEANDSAEAVETFYSTGSSGKCVPRAIFIDLEPTVIGKLVIVVCGISYIISAPQMRSALGHIDNSFILISSSLERKMQPITLLVVTIVLGGI